MEEKLEDLQAEIRERRQTEERLEKLNRCFLEFGVDPIENINRLTALCGELMGATCALYNRLDHGMLCSWGQWNTPSDYKQMDSPEGHICYDVIKHGGGKVLVIHNLPETKYARTDPNVEAYKLKTYVGRAVKFGKDYVGSLCVVYQKDFLPREEDKRFMGIIASAIGVEENRMVAKKALQQSEEKYRALIDNIQDGVFIIQDGKIQFANEAFARMGGYTVEQVVGKDFREFVAPEVSKMVTDRYYRRQTGEDVPTEYEIHAVHRDGTKVIAYINVWLITYRGRIASMGTVKDITEKRRLESQLFRAQRMESLGTLAGGIAHDINNLLTPIMLSLEPLREKLTDEDSQRLLNIIEKSTHRGASLMKQVQSFARGIDGERKAIQITDIILEIERITKGTFPKSIEIEIDISNNIWTISGDATQLHQVLMNLCVNARDAMPNGGTLSISAENIYLNENHTKMNIEAKVGSYIVIRISDTGVGIPPEILDRIFEPFFTTKKHGKGTGLGLSTALAIVKGHSGFIEVFSETGKGTIFKVYLPVVKITEIKKLEEQKFDLHNGHGELILVVDDEVQIRESTKAILEAHGYRVFTADNGAKAIELYLQHREEIKATLMDMMMPIMDGPTSIRALRKINPDFKVIAISGAIDRDKLVKASDNYVQAFLTKPYTVEKLLNTLYEVIGAKE